jgi:translation initiation factor 1 (eIF-1/SUI1)
VAAVSAGGGAEGGGGGQSSHSAWALDPLLSDALFRGGEAAKDPQAGAASMPPKEVRRRFLKRLEQWTRVSGGALEKPMHARGEPPKVVLPPPASPATHHLARLLSALWLFQAHGQTRDRSRSLEIARDRPHKRPAQSLAPPQKVVLTTEQRRGHSVTCVAELAAYSIDPYTAARELAGVCGATANVEEEALKSGVQKRVVSVQGLWDRSITEWLAAKHGLPPSCVENRAAAMKGPGHAQKKEKKATNVRRA